MLFRSEEISRVWARGPASTLELARVVSVARNELPHGAWSSLWKKSGQMPFSKRQGYLLLTIGDGLGWANVHTCAHLPAGVRTLHHLARLDRETIDRLIQDGVIHPALKESEAKRLLAQFQGKTAENRQAKSRISQRLRRFEDFVRASLSDWTTEERKLAIEGLTRVLERIRGADGVKRNGAVSDFAGGPLNHHRNSL